MVHTRCYPYDSRMKETDGRQEKACRDGRMHGKEEEKMTGMRGKGFYIATLALILLIVFCVRGTVFSRENDERQQRNRYYAALEEEYLEETRALLHEAGLTDCGVNLRWVSCGDGSREYTVSLHHDRLARMPEADREALRERLSEADFHGDMCHFTYVLQRY